MFRIKRRSPSEQPAGLANVVRADLDPEVLEPVVNYLTTATVDVPDICPLGVDCERLAAVLPPGLARFASTLEVPHKR
jgi:hypothetical protein